MSLIFLFSLLIASLIALLIKKNRFVFLLISLNLFLFFAIGSGLLPEVLLDGLQIHAHLDKPLWKNNNVIILLGSGSVRWGSTSTISSKIPAYSRLFEATRLYFDCKKNSSNCRLLISGGDPGGNGLPEANLISKELNSLGIPLKDMITEVQSKNTLQSAQFSSDIIKKEALDQIIIVTSGTHMNRSLMLFKNKGINATPAPADYLSVSHSWKQFYNNFYIMDLALHEYVGILKFQISF